MYPDVGRSLLTRTLFSILSGLQRNHLTDKPQHTALQCEEYKWDHLQVAVGEGGAAAQVDQSRTNAHDKTGLFYNPFSSVR